MLDMDPIYRERRPTETERELELEDDAARGMREREEIEDARMERLEDEELYEDSLPSRSEVHGKQPKFIVPLIVIALCLLAFIWIYRRETTQVSSVPDVFLPEAVIVETDDIRAYALPVDVDKAEWMNVLENYMLEQEHAVRGTVTVMAGGGELDVHAGPSEMYKTVGKVHDGTTFSVLLWARDDSEARGESNLRWYLIASENPKSLKGWVPADHLDTSALRVARSN